jgi:hypothetical protein
MRILLIGGLERAEPHFERLAIDAGYEVVFHDGRTGGRGAETLMRLIDRSDVVVVLTDVNSHGGVQIARRHMKEHGRTPLLMRRISLSKFSTLLEALERRVQPNALALGA